MDDEKTPITAAQRSKSLLSAFARFNALTAADFDALSDDQKLALPAVLNDIARMTEEVRHKLVREVCTRGMYATKGYESPEAYLSGLLNLTTSEAAARVRAAYRV